MFLNMLVSEEKGCYLRLSYRTQSVLNCTQSYFVPLHVLIDLTFLSSPAIKVALSARLSHETYHNIITKYITISCFTLHIYDHMLSLNDEVCLFSLPLFFQSYKLTIYSGRICLEKEEQV